MISLMKMLLLEDDSKLAPHLIQLFQEIGFKTDHFTSLSDFKEASGAKSQIDFMVVDRLIGQKDSKELLPSLRLQHPTTPIIVLSAISTPNEKSDLLNMGADDYLSKPFSSQELGARIRALLRRASVSNPNYIKVGNLVIDLTKRIISIESRKEILPAKEFLLLHTLAQQQGRVWNKHDLLAHVWGQTADLETNVVEATVTNLRKKLSDLGAKVIIKNARGMGYWIED